MNWKPGIVLLALLTLSCAQGPAYKAETLGKDEKAVEDQADVVVLEMDLISKVKDVGTKASRLPDGRLKVQSRLLNQSGKELHLQIQTVFKDDSGFTTEKETPWEHTLVQAGDTLNYDTNSLNDKATRFVIKVREVKE